MRRASRVDATHGDVKRAIRALGFPFLDLHASGGGIEDFLVGIPKVPPRWVLVEAKSPRNKRGEVTSSQYTPAQIEWRFRTEGFPRITAISFEDALTQLRALAEQAPGPGA